MSAYAKLADILAARDERAWKISFSELGELLGVSLPASAFKYPAWWSNNPSNNSMTKIWLNAGWRTEQVDIPGQTVVFRRAQTPRIEGAFSGFGDRSRAYEMASTRAPETKAFRWPAGKNSMREELSAGQAAKGGIETILRLRLQALLAMSGMNANALAEKSGVRESSIHAILRGTTSARIDTVEKLAIGLGVTPWTLLGADTHFEVASGRDDDSPFENEAAAIARDEAFAKKHGRKVRFEDLYGCMKGTMKIMPGVDLTEPLTEEWAANEAKWDARFADPEFGLPSLSPDADKRKPR